MRICLVGGIFGKPGEYRATITRTPETVLESGLRDRGHRVATYSHFVPVRFSGFDVVHVHHLSFGAIAAAAAEPKAPLVFTSHAFRRLSWARRVAMSYVLSNAEASVVLSESEAAWQRRVFPGATVDQYVIPNGIDEKVFAHQAPVLPAAGKPWRLLYVGQLAEIKGVEYLLRALPLIASELRVDLDLVYHVRTAEEQLRREARQLGLRNVHFLGARQPAELAALYADAHVLVLPSTAEAFPTVIAEALLVGRPIVATDVGGVQGQVGSFGEVVEPRRPQALADGINRVLQTYERLSARSEAVSADAATRYSVTAMLDAHEAMYEACMNGPAPSATVVRRLRRGSLGRFVAMAQFLRRPRSPS
jgi:D-inositol-3-phosphate glycosyltransferase